MLKCAAIAFTYFEALVRLGDVNKFDEEEARLNSLGNLLEHIGYVRDIWIDFAEEAFELLHKLANSLRNMDGQAADILLTTFNSMGESMAIITYVKVGKHALFRQAPELITDAASCQRLDTDSRRQLQAFHRQWRRQGLLCQLH